MSKWRQYLRIWDRNKRHNVVLFESQDLPPHDREFIVFLLKDKEMNNTYLIRKGGELIDSLTIGEKLSYIEWVGRAKWNKSNEMFDIETTSKGVDNGFVSVKELESNMRWSTLPENWRWWQPNYKQIIKEQKVKRPSFFTRVFK